MRAGQLRHHIVIERPIEVAESTMGQPVPTWEYFAEVWADVSPVSGSERFIAQQLIAEVSHTIRMRYLSGVTAKMRARLRSGGSWRIFLFSSVLNFRERNREIVIAATEEVPDRA